MVLRVSSCCLSLIHQSEQGGAFLAVQVLFSDASSQNCALNFPLFISPKCSENTLVAVLADKNGTLTTGRLIS